VREAGLPARVDVISAAVVGSIVQPEVQPGNDLRLHVLPVIERMVARMRLAKQDPYIDIRV